MILYTFSIINLNLTDLYQINNKLQEKGALSGCMKDDNYVDNYL